MTNALRSVNNSMENQNTSSVEHAPEQPPMQSVGSGTLLGWISCRDRLPKEKDADDFGDCWWWMPRHASHGAQKDYWDAHDSNDATHWMHSDGYEADGEQPEPPQPNK